MEVSPWFWVGFNAAVVVMLLVDLLVLQRDAHAISMREAGLWSAFWILLSLAFCGWIYQQFGSEAGLEWLTAYVVEKSLSVDNIFVFVMVFLTFGVAPKYQHRVLFWGILAALILRGIFITAGVWLFHQFDWIVYVFGAFLVYTGVRMGLERNDEHIDLENNWLLLRLRKWLPLTPDFREGNFFVRENGKLMATPLFLVVLIFEFIDLIFAVDSIPAVLAVTDDYFIAYTSNIAAILGLRALYFLLASVVGKFRYLQSGLAIILTFVGIKMLIAHWYHVPVALSLTVILVVLSTSVIASLLVPQKEETKTEAKSEGQTAGV